MNKKENRMAVRQTAEKAVNRDRENRRIKVAATRPVKDVLQELGAALRGLDEEKVAASRSRWGSNKVTHEKKQPLIKRLAGVFINPFTAILFCLALVSAATDMVFPALSLFGSIIVLDEATAFSDPENEYLIQKAFEKLMQGKTVIIIAHRLSTIRNADKIIVMEKGHLVEEGKRDELVAAGGRYAQMWNHYTEAIGWKISGKAV